MYSDWKQFSFYQYFTGGFHKNRKLHYEVSPDELNHELSSTIAGIDKEMSSISIINDEVL